MKPFLLFVCMILAGCTVPREGSQPAAATATFKSSGTFIHPGVVFDQTDIQRMRALRDVEPWKTGFDQFAKRKTAQIDYRMRGPFEVVGREPDDNLRDYENDMKAVHDGAIMWVMTGDKRYAENAMRILDTWAVTHKRWVGSTPRLAAGWNAMIIGTGAEILRHTYPGWTDSATAHVESYLIEVMWPMLGGLGQRLPNLADANQGAMELRGAMAIAVFCSDRARFEAVIDAFLNHPCAGLVNSTLPSGQFSDFGRDQTHAGGMLQDLAFAAETAWKQNVDLYGALDNRLLACIEYYAKYNLGRDVPYVPFGAAYEMYPSPSYDMTQRGTLPDPRRQLSQSWVALMEMYRGAYGVRKGLETPQLNEYLGKLKPNHETFLYRQAAGSVAKTPPIPSPQRPLSKSQRVTSLSGAQIGAPGRQTILGQEDGVWRIEGSGSVIGGKEDRFSFAYLRMTGDGMIIARVNVPEAADSSLKAGVMIRDSLDAKSNFAASYLCSKGAAFDIRTENRMDPGLKKAQVHRAATTRPYWVKVERRGEVFTGYNSNDGETWTPCRYGRIKMAPTVYVGLALCSEDPSAFAGVTFDNVKAGFERMNEQAPHWRLARDNRN